MGTLKITNLLVSSNLGYETHLHNFRQDLLVNISLNYNRGLEEASDNPSDSLDVMRLTKEIIGMAETGHFNLLEAFTRMVLNTVLEYPRVNSATVEVIISKSIQFSGELSFVLSGSNR